MQKTRVIQQFLKCFKTTLKMTDFRFTADLSPGFSQKPGLRPVLLPALEYAVCILQLLNK